eukprot:TRINITY_DN2359_c0_g1_i1.p1 TRINITY_DN2359_c0_g1~~TRINITY_DN2359_c0_g1_i1.p1  ORF type:complete len:336 (+),score=77.60 TRINITY_DN2359_c0_g1_i1:1043-2050(+)
MNFRYSLGVFVLVFASLIFVTTSVISELLYSHINYDSSFGLTATIVLTFCSYLPRWLCLSNEEKKGYWKQLRIPAFLYMLVFYCGNFFYFDALKISKAAVGPVETITNSACVFSLIFSIIFFSHKINWRLILALCGCFGGVIISMLNDMSRSGYVPINADIEALVAAIFFGSYATVIEWMFKGKEGSSLEVTLLFSLVGVYGIFATIPFGFLFSSFKDNVFLMPDFKQFALMLVVCFATMIGESLYVHAAVMTSPLVASVSMGLTIPIAICYDAFFFKDIVSTLQIIGILFFLACFVFLNIVEYKSQQLKNEIDEVEAIYEIANGLDENQPLLDV